MSVHLLSFGNAQQHGLIADRVEQLGVGNDSVCGSTLVRQFKIADIQNRALPHRVILLSQNLLDLCQIRVNDDIS